MVILLHREDAYEKESPRAGEADFIVAKHRNGPTDTVTVAFQGHYRASSTWPTDRAAALHRSVPDRRSRLRVLRAPCRCESQVTMS